MRKPSKKPSGKPFAPKLPASLTAKRRGDIAILRLSRPQKRNALDDTTILGIEAFFKALPKDIKAVVIHGAGQHFSAGLDLSELTERNTAEAVQHSRMWHRVFDAMQFGKVPIVAVLHGAVVGGGLELAAACHLRVAERSAYYALPEGSRGIFLGGGGSVRLPRLIGVSRVMELMLTGRTYGAEEGQSFGLSQCWSMTAPDLPRASSSPSASPATRRCRTSPSCTRCRASRRAIRRAAVHRVADGFGRLRTATTPRRG